MWIFTRCSRRHSQRRSSIVESSETAAPSAIALTVPQSTATWYERQLRMQALPGRSSDWQPTPSTLRPVTVLDVPLSWYGWSVANALYTKLEEAAKEITCREWYFGAVLSPDKLLAKFEAERASQPGPIPDHRVQQAVAKWGVVFRHPPMPNSRTGADSSRLQEAFVDLTPDQIRDMSIHELRKSCVGVIIERELHELLEFAQLRTNPGVPLFNPHHYTEDLVDIVEKIANSLLEHADVG
jgi:hypothetical protein